MLWLLLDLLLFWSGDNPLAIILRRDKYPTLPPTCDLKHFGHQWDAQSERDKWREHRSYLHKLRLFYSLDPPQWDRWLRECDLAIDYWQLVYDAHWNFDEHHTRSHLGAIKSLVGSERYPWWRPVELMAKMERAGD